MLCILVLFYLMVMCLFHIRIFIMMVSTIQILVNKPEIILRLVDTLKFRSITISTIMIISVLMLYGILEHMLISELFMKFKMVYPALIMLWRVNLIFVIVNLWALMKRFSILLIRILKSFRLKTMLMINMEYLGILLLNRK